jgi:HlyD family secretion protein
LSFSTAGTVTVLNVNAGDAVTAGQVLARIDPADAQSAVDDAQTNVTNAEQSLADAKAAASAAASPTPSATNGHGSSQPSGGTGGGSGGSGGGTNSGSGGSGGKTQRASTGTDAIYSATVQLNNAKLALLQAQRKLAGCTITAPIAGTVLSVSGAVGATETPGGTAFISVGSVADTQVKAAFSEADVARVAVGQVATIKLPNQTATVTGKVSSVDPAGTASSNLVRYAVMIGFDQPPAALLYGSSANVTVTTASATNVLYVSTSAVRDVQDGAGTVTVRANGHDEPRTVRIGLRGDQYTEITSGLTEGEQVVITNG